MSASTKTWLNNNPPSVEDDDLNGFAAENNNLILGSGQALSIGDNQQTHEAVSVYAHGGNFYTDGGAADAYVLSAIGAKVAPPSYFDGMSIEFIAGNDNTGASTVNVATLGVKSLLTSAGSPLKAGKLISGLTYKFTYNGAAFISVDRLLYPPISGEAGIVDYGHIVGDVQRYGAVGGATDETTEFNLALALSNITVYLTPGRTYLTTGLTASGDNIKIVMNGATIKQSVLAANDGAPIIDVTGDNFRIEDYGIIDGQQALQPADGFSDSFNAGVGGLGRYYRAAIGADGGVNANTRLTIKNVEFKNTYGACVATEALDDVTVSDCFAKDCLFELAFIIAITGNVDRVRVQDNEMQNIASGDGAVNANGIVVSDVKNIIITGNKGANIERNLIKGEGFTYGIITDNVIDTNTIDNFSGIQLQPGTNNELVTAIIADNAIYNCGRGIDLNTDTSTAVRVHGNLIDTTTGSTSGDGILVSGDIVSVDISDNTVLNATRYAIRVDVTDATVDQTLLSIKDNTLTGDAGVGVNYGIAVELDDTYNINLLDISNNMLSNFRAALGDGWLQIARASGTGVVENCVIQGNKCFGAGTARVFFVSGDYLTAGLVSNNYFDGDINFAVTGVRFDRSNYFALDSNTSVVSELTISAGAITISNPYHRIDTEADAATDDLSTINGGADGDILVLSAVIDSRTVVVKDGGGNLRLSGDMTLDNSTDTITLMKRSTVWIEMSRSDNGA